MAKNKTCFNYKIKEYVLKINLRQMKYEIFFTLFHSNNKKKMN